MSTLPSANADPHRDLAHLGHVELLTPRPEESLRFFTEVFGMSEAAREGQSVYLRAFGDFELATLKLTEARQAGLAHTAWRAHSPAAPAPRGAGGPGGGGGGGGGRGGVGGAPR